ncbi:MAG: hypothetical protein HN526_17555, partial [Gammaproteobacteria bacterium]|nr:hypothetical protein [Gammaproteobacteria bacterium]
MHDIERPGGIAQTFRLPVHREPEWKKLLLARVVGKMYLFRGCATLIEMNSPERINSPERVFLMNSPERINSLERINSPERINSLERINSPERVFLMNSLERINSPERVFLMNSLERIN